MTTRERILNNLPAEKAGRPGDSNMHHFSNSVKISETKGLLFRTQFTSPFGGGSPVRFCANPGTSGAAN